MNEDSFQFAVENTRLVLPPQRRLETFGTTMVNYYLVTEGMDNVALSHVREGRIEAEKPQILSPHHFSKLLVEGFGEKAEAYAAFISENAHRFAFLRHGFRFRKNEIRSYEVHEPLETVLGRVRDEVKAKDDAMSAVVAGVEDGWEVCLLKFMIDLIHTSAPWQMEEMRRRGFLGEGGQQ
ncbi:hypothetical protein SAMN05444156_1835 [Verrucomicrobium sp. GAS474]|uniref:hypothetical protein n=1 Tax=Verrucomicrobium sp. GAS474 TaxID=1882831 RepID=UPI00087999E9|nr:hypothetical protein [Verrucomicrobium sp. GAS474]SDU07896.1 hypothetical protein SAMN05444156_1835 [Verrucomicrobium sp. GAS474]